VVLGAYRETGLMARVVQQTLCKTTYVARGWRYAETVRCRGERVSGRREYGGERAEAGAGMNRNELELNRKSTTFPSPNLLNPQISREEDSRTCLSCEIVTYLGPH
jgi:hypothetical protein